jgi:hypothetical protein
MEQKRKIIIPLGGSREAIPARDFDGATTAPAPLFDAEATLGARPVVPLAETPQPSRQFPLLALVVVLAISAGVAGGFAIGIYRSRQAQQSVPTATTATSSAPTTPTTTISADATTAPPPPAQQLPATVASEKTPEPERATASNAAAVERTARDNRTKRDEEQPQQVIPPVEVRERGREKGEREVRDREDKIAKEDEREFKRQKRERRRRARENDEANGDVNQQIERGARELNRIREIFEGQRP